MKQIFIDLESSALDESQLLPIMPEFLPSANLVDPVKIKANIESKRQDWLGGAALKPTTGRVIAASLCKDEKEPEFYTSDDEFSILTYLDCEIRFAIGQGGYIYGWNLFGFDLPFFCGRCAVYGIPVFKSFTINYRGRWSWNEAFVDPMQIWAGPGQRHDGTSLKNVAYALGLGLKDGSGKDFDKLLRDDPVAARAYSIRDVELLRGVVRKMGL